jgi:hypothetical protein
MRINKKFCTLSILSVHIYPLFLTISQCALDDVAIISEEATAASYGCTADSGTQLYKEVQQATPSCSSASKTIPLGKVVYPWGQLILPCHDWVKQNSISDALFCSFP